MARRVSFQSGNPTMRNFKRSVPFDTPVTERMTVQGTVNKAVILLVLALASATWTWTSVSPDARGVAVLGGLVVGLLLALAIIFRSHWAPVLAPVYALAQGVLLGAISAMYESVYEGITILAFGLTFGTLFALFGAYTSRLIRVTQKFRMGVVAATGGIFLLYMASLVLRLFGVTMPLLHDASPIGIGISLVIVIVAALNLVLDFDLIERGAAAGAPRHMEWYGAFSLLVTLVWLYLEMLRLLSKLRQ